VRYLIKRKPRKVFDRFERLRLGEIEISAVTYSELNFCVANSSAPERDSAALQEFIAPLEVAPYTPEVGPVYGELRRRPIGPLDTLIAAHALHLAAVLVTNNAKEFARVPGLELENST
jgi:tRNA(fMet)-specific endonuclease VapC